MRVILIILLIIGTSACANKGLPRSSDELKSSAAKKWVFCSDLEMQKTYDILVENSIRCHSAKGTENTPFSGVLGVHKTWIVNSLNPLNTHAEINVRYKDVVYDVYLQTIELNTGTNCETEVLVYQLNNSKNG